ncbi:hypothetical protein HK105_201652 [Polyrhizophydium stewartii]|uniref:Uncharacterized protein n=1 Tax=Polyrhizophydium stewartii TaxID=2732419 RepID=A0ABR4NH17_9FUNG
MSSQPAQPPPQPAAAADPPADQRAAQVATAARRSTASVGVAKPAASDAAAPASAAAASASAAAAPAPSGLSDDDGPTPSSGEQIRRIVRFIRPEYSILAAAIFFLLISSVVTMLVPMSMGTIIDLVMQELGASVGDTGSGAPAMVMPQAPRLSESIRQNLSLTTVFIALSCIFVVGAAANMTRVILMQSAAERIIVRLRNSLFVNIIKQDISFHDANRSGELISRLSADTVVVGKTLTSNLSDGLRSLVMAVAGLSAMLLVNVNLTMTMMMIVPPVAFSAVYYGRFVRQLAKKRTDGTAEITKFAEEKISNLRTVRAFAREDDEAAKYAGHVQNVYNLGMKEAYASGLFFGSTGLAGNLIMLAILFYGGSMVKNGAISVGELTSFFMYTAYVGGSVFGLTSWYSEMNKGIGSSTRLFKLLDRKAEIEATRGRTLDAVQGEIALQNVHFAYPTRSDVAIFNGLNFTVKPGETVAIVGHSGSGKSTIAQLILRFYDPAHGEVKLDGVDVRELDPHWMRESVIALVPQEPVLFAATVRDNIKYGNPAATDAEVRAAAERANAHDFIASFPEGYDTFVGERGHAISGGQKQRIAIARALLKNPRVLVLDEATSALDAASEHLVQDAIERLILGRTVITIAHRLSTIQKADRIIMIDGGQVAESGSFDELMSDPEGSFFKLVSNQLSQNLAVEDAAAAAATATSTAAAAPHEQQQQQQQVDSDEDTIIDDVHPPKSA